MDYKDIELGSTEDFFWFKAKKELIDILLERVSIARKSYSATRSDDTCTPLQPGNVLNDREKTNAFPNKRAIGNKVKILNIGCGIGKELEVIKQFGDVYLVDIEPQVIASIPDDLCIEKKVYDVSDGIPYPDNYFDIVVAFDLFEHLKNDIFVIGEIHRILKPHGFLVFTVPAFQYLFSGHDKMLQHYRRYNIRMLRNRFHKFTSLETGFWACSLFLPVAFERFMKHHESNPAFHFKIFNRFFNNLFYNVLKCENHLIRYKVPLPFGTTIFGIYQNIQNINNVSPVQILKG